MLKPLGDRVIIRVLEKEEKTKSGIFLPDTAKEKPQEGEVVAVGAGKVYDNGKTNLPLHLLKIRWYLFPLALYPKHF